MLTLCRLSSGTETGVVDPEKTANRSFLIDTASASRLLVLVPFMNRDAQSLDQNLYYGNVQNLKKVKR